MNYAAWKPIVNTHIIPILSTHTPVPDHIQALDQGQDTPGQVMRFTHWPIQQACLPL